MTDESPINFRSTKPGLSVTDWIGERTQRAALIYTGAAVFLAMCALMATFGTFGVVCGVLLALNAMTCGVWRSLVVLLAIAVVAGLFLLQRNVDGDDREAIAVDAGTRGKITLRLSRLTGDSWMMFLDNPSVELHPIARIGTSILLMAPRLAKLSLRMWRLSRQLKTIDRNAVGAGLDLLMQSGRGVPIGDLLQEFPSADPQKLIGELTMIDGVVLLASDTPSLTVTPAIDEEFQEWKKEARRKRQG